MYDCLHLRFTLSPEEFGYAAFQDSLAMQHGTLTRPDAMRWQLRYRGMRLDYWPHSGQGRIRGSLHTFFHNHNSGPFAATEVPAACQQLADTFGLCPHSLAVENLEVGINIPLPQTPSGFLAALLAHKGSQFYPQQPPARTTRPLLFVATHHDYRVKAYDKGVYNRVQGVAIRQAPPHLLRFEVAYTRARPIKQLLKSEVLTLAVIAQPAAVQRLAEELRQHWYCVEHQFEPDFTGLSLDDMLLLHAATEPALWQAARKTTPARTLSRRKARSRQLRRRAEQSSSLVGYHERFEQQLAVLLTDIAETPELAAITPATLSEHTWPGFHPCNQLESSVPSQVPAFSPSSYAKPISHSSCNEPAHPIRCFRHPQVVALPSVALPSVALPSVALPSVALPLSPTLPANSVQLIICSLYSSCPSPWILFVDKVKLKQDVQLSIFIQTLDSLMSYKENYTQPINLICNSLHTQLANKRIRPPPWLLETRFSRLQHCYQCCCQAAFKRYSDANQ